MSIPNVPIRTSYSCCPTIFPIGTNIGALFENPQRHARQMLTITRVADQTTASVSEMQPPSSSTSTGCLSKHSYHWMMLPTRKHHEPQKVASEPWYRHPLLLAAKPSAPQSVKPMPFTGVRDLFRQSF